MTDNNDLLEEDWGELENNSLLEQHKAKIAGAVAVVAVGGWAFYSQSNISLDDARVDLLKRDYDSAVSVATSIMEDSTDDYEIAEAQEILAKIYSDDTSDYFDPNEAYELYSSIFEISPSVGVARLALEFAEQTEVSDKLKVGYWEFLAKKKDLAATVTLVDFYLSSNNSRAKTKALKFLKGLPQTADVKLKIAKIYNNPSSGAYYPQEAGKLLEEASRSGNAEASMLYSKLKLDDAKSDKLNAQSHLAKYVELVTKSINLGYKGEDALQAINVIKYGRHNVPRDPNLAKKLLKKLNKSE
ncbi:hypothetical protein [Vibrio crassostreae]|uniref:hypothetical protein n=1 Tax=Vibrio crassostreae TaxID=246167 RepID=UPI001B30D499|nr:hypothetical protein [Vibrio crassostreae]